MPARLSPAAPGVSIKCGGNAGVGKIQAVRENPQGLQYSTRTLHFIFPPTLGKVLRYNNGFELGISLLFPYKWPVRFKPATEIHKQPIH